MEARKKLVSGFEPGAASLFCDVFLSVSWVSVFLICEMGGRKRTGRREEGQEEVHLPHRGGMRVFLSMSRLTNRNEKKGSVRLGMVGRQGTGVTEGLQRAASVPGPEENGGK